MNLKKLYEEILNEPLAEEYPLSFSMKDFKTLNSFNKRIKYCQQHLTRISSGSSRIVYKIDDEKVLKLARNKKGLAQNEVEITQGNEGYLEDVVANVFDAHPDDLWVEMELARKLKTADFRRITGFHWKDFVAAVHNYGNQSGNNGRNTFDMGVDANIVEAMWEDEFVYGIFTYIGNYGIPSGDLEKMNSYGVVTRNGSDHIVIIDFGFTQEVKDTHYS
jgi:hypothetical protein